MNVLTSNGSIITLSDTPLSKGGEGAVYKIAGQKDYCAKIYHESKRTPIRLQKLSFMIKNKPNKLITKDFIICWPVDIIYSMSKDFIGFIMPLAFQNSILLYQLCRPSLNSDLSTDWNQFYNRKTPEGLINRLKLIFNLSIPIYHIHSTNKYVMADFKPQNVMITSQGKISMIDLDSVQIVDKNNVFLAPVATPDYLPPELQYNKNLGHMQLNIGCDLFAMSIVFYQVLYGIHPFQVSAKDSNCTELRQNIALNLFPFGVNSCKISVIPKPHKKFLVLPQEIKNLFILAFELNPNKRPSSETWGKTIYKFLSNL